MEISYKTKGTCCSEIQFTVEDGVVKKVDFIGGCMGNSQGVSKLVEGMQVDEVITRLAGINCGFRTTSCPDQLAKALKQTTN